jgi:hypothetical protein
LRSKTLVPPETETKPLCSTTYQIRRAGENELQLGAHTADDIIHCNRPDRDLRVVDDR